MNVLNVLNVRGALISTPIICPAGAAPGGAPPPKKAERSSSSSRVLDLASELSKALGMKKRATHNAASGASTVFES